MIVRKYTLIQSTLPSLFKHKYHYQKQKYQIIRPVDQDWSYPDSISLNRQETGIPNYGTAGEEIAKQKGTIEFLHKPIVREKMWQIQENDFGQEVWIQVDMSECHKKQVPTRHSSLGK